MAGTDSGSEIDPEIAAISSVNEALRSLKDPAAQQRVLDYVVSKLGLTRQPVKVTGIDDRSMRRELDASSHTPSNAAADTTDDQAADDLDGISTVAVKWMRRNGLAASQISAVFSLGADEIDLVAKTVPGKTKKERMHSVFLLKGIAAYLGTGAARVMHDEVKEACLHYDAFDTANFAAYLKSFAAEVSGAKDSGYTLTARGMTTATEIIKALVSTKS